MSSAELIPTDYDVIKYGGTQKILFKPWKSWKRRYRHFDSADHHRSHMPHTIVATLTHAVGKSIKTPSSISLAKISTREMTGNTFNRPTSQINLKSIQSLGDFVDKMNNLNILHCRKLIETTNSRQKMKIMWFHFGKYKQNYYPYKSYSGSKPKSSVKVHKTRPKKPLNIPMKLFFSVCKLSTDACQMQMAKKLQKQTKILKNW